MTKQEYFTSLVKQGLSDEEAYKLATEYENNLAKELSIKNKIGEGLKTVGTIGMLAGGIPLALANPITTATGVAFGTGIDKLLNVASDDKYLNWGLFMQSMFGGPEQSWQFTNPGYFIGIPKAKIPKGGITLNNIINEPKTNSLSYSDIVKQLSKAKESLKALYTSDDYINRLQKVFPTLQRGDLELKVSLIIENMLDINNIKTSDLGNIGGKIVQTNQGLNFNTELILNNKLSLKDIYETIVHELGGHNATKMFDFSKVTNFQNILSNLKKFNVGKDIMKYNSLIRPTLKPEVNLNMTLKNLANDINSDLEIRARAIVTIDAAKKKGISIQDLLLDVNAPLNTKELLSIFTKDSLLKYLTEFAVLSGAVAVVDKDVDKFYNGGVFNTSKFKWKTNKLIKNSEFKRDMRKKQFPGTLSYTNSRIYNKLSNKVTLFIPNTLKYKNGGSMSGLEWASIQKIIGSGILPQTDWFTLNIDDSNINNVDVSGIINNDPYGLDNYNSLNEIVEDFYPSINMSSFNILPATKVYYKGQLNKDSRDNSKKLKSDVPNKQLSSSIDHLAAKALEYIRNGGTFNSPTAGVQKWTVGGYKGLCTTGSYHVLGLLGLPISPAEKINFNGDLSGKTLQQMGLSYFTTINPKDPYSSGYIPKNGDTAIWPKFVRSVGKNKGTITQHLATYLNGKWYSDTELNKMSCYYSDPNEPMVKIYRIND